MLLCSRQISAPKSKSFSCFPASLEALPPQKQSDCPRFDCPVYFKLAGVHSARAHLLASPSVSSKLCSLLTSQNLRISQGNSPSFHNKASKLNMTCKTYCTLSEKKMYVNLEIFWMQGQFSCLTIP